MERKFVYKIMETKNGAYSTGDPIFPCFTTTAGMHYAWENLVDLIFHIVSTDAIYKNFYFSDDIRIIVTDGQNILDTIKTNDTNVVRLIGRVKENLELSTR